MEHIISATNKSLHKHKEKNFSTRIDISLDDELKRVSLQTGISVKRIVHDSLILGLSKYRLTE